MPSSCVRDVMTSSVVTLSPHQTFREAVNLIANRRFRHFVVVEADSKLAGVISDRDLLRVFARWSDLDKETVNEVMTKEPVTVRPETPLSAAVEEILGHRINCLPVVDEKGRVCGIVTSTDLLEAFRKIQASVERDMGS